MNIPWKTKSFLFALIDAMNLSPALYFAQKNLTRRAQVSIADPKDSWIFHAHNLEKMEKPKVLEFGAGKNLAQNIYLSTLCRHQTLVDINPMFDPGLVDAAAASLSRLKGIPYFKITSAADLAFYNITYIAPLDISRSPFAENAFDACISTDTLEHIPRASLISIFMELKRIVRKQGCISAYIDYSDHYSHTDSHINRLEFLKFGEAEYARYNHRSHYQNRLRHADFKRLFEDLGFAVLSEEARDFVKPPSSLSSGFDSLSPTIFATKGLFLLENKK